jgi:fructose-1,6-bisphosphatase I
MPAAPKPVPAGTTLTNYLLSVGRSRLNSLEGNVPHTSQNPSKNDGVEDLVTLLGSITLAVKSVGALVRSFGIGSAQGGGKVAGEGLRDKAVRDLKVMNERANAIWINALLYSGKTCLLVSEELEEPVVVEEGLQGKYCVVFDPLTGLSDPPSQDMGSIFGVFHKMGATGEVPGLEDVMQPARNLVAAGYALYGSCTVLMFSVGDGVHCFTLDPSLNEFILTDDHVKIPFSGNIYSINEGRTAAYDNETQEMLKCIKAEPALDGSARTCRYIGSMVADIHRTFIKGGIFMYPPHKDGYPDGRLKLLYEAGPMAFMVTQAGGGASTGRAAILDIVPKSIHDRVAVFLGSEDSVSFATGFYRKAPWGRTKDDPMFSLRRTLSIGEGGGDKKQDDKAKAQEGEDGDGVICFHFG